MATARLIPSTYYLSNSSYLSVSNAANMYNDTDNDTYATVTNSQTGTSSYYIYIRGFDFDSIPSAAVVSSFTVKFKVRESGVTTSTSYRPYLCNNTTTITGTASMPSTTATTITFTGVTATWDTIKGYGDNFGIRINCRRSSRNTTAYLYIYGAEIEVEYTVPNPRTITTTLSGDGAISPSGSNTYYDGDDFELTITPTDKSAEVSVTKDGADVTSQLVAHYAGGTEEAVLGSYTLVSGSFNGQGASYFSGLVGNGADAATTSTNYYSGGSGTIAVFTYDMGFSLPSNATVERVWCEVSGHAESTSNSSEYMCAMLISGSTELTDELNFKDVGTSNTVQTLECETLPTVAQLASMKLQCRLGYYGGAINGATAYVTYSVPASGGPEYYTLSFTVSGNSTIAVVIGGSSGPELYVKQGSSWVKVSAAYVKSGGSWQQVSVDSAFSSGVNYVRG